MRTCFHTMPDGHQCGSPAMRSNIRCYFHARQSRRATRTIRDLPLISDRATRTFLLSEIVNAIWQGTMDAETAGALLFAIQIETHGVL